MDLCWTDRVALVSGSSRGIGRAIARTFLAEGARVVVTGRQPDSLAQTTAALQAEFGQERVLGLSGDLSQTAHVATVVRRTREQWGEIDCVVANIGSGTAKNGWQLNQADWDPVFDVNFWSGVRLVEGVLPGMVNARRGSITFIASIVGVESVSAPLPYSAAKAAVVNYSKNLARQVGQYGVRVNCVAPGNILFPGGSWDQKLAQNREPVERYIEGEVALRRFGTPEEIAALVVFLASERAAFVTGACVVADGGQIRATWS